jgi:hypothetical protein
MAAGGLGHQPPLVFVDVQLEVRYLLHSGNANTFTLEIVP